MSDQENTKSTAAACPTESALLYGEWQSIETAPKGYPSLEEPSEWFLAYGDKYAGPNGGKIAVIRRCFGHGFGKSKN